MFLCDVRCHNSLKSNDTSSLKQAKNKMEKENIFHCTDKTNVRAKNGRPPTRLQRHAPASLQLDQAVGSGNPVGVSFENSISVIPLLSPVVAPPLTEISMDVVRVGCLEHQQGKGMEEKRGTANFSNYSTLLTDFQTQCKVVNRVQ